MSKIISFLYPLMVMMMLMILANLRWAARDQGLYENPGWHKPLHILNDVMY